MSGLSMMLFFGIPFVLWMCGLAFIWFAICMGVREWGERHQFRKKRGD